MANIFSVNQLLSQLISLTKTMFIPAILSVNAPSIPCSSEWKGVFRFINRNKIMNFFDFSDLMLF